MKKSIIVIFLVVLMTLSYASAGYWYVSRDGSNADGQSWTTAWSDVGNIGWDLINPGDTIYLDGGTDSMSYGRIITGKGGSSGSPITISRSTDPGHDGKVYLSGAEIDHPYITIDGLDKDMLEVHGTGGYTFRVQGNSDHFELDNIYIWGNASGAWGVFIYVTSGGMTIRDSEISGQSATEDQMKYYSDGDLLIENSVFHGWRSIGGSHSDFLESCNSANQGSCPGGNIIVRNNIFYDAPHDCFMMADTAFHDVEFTGNIFYNVQDAIKLYSADSIKSYNNFFYDCRDLVTYISSPSDCANNIYSGVSPFGTNNPVSVCGSIHNSLWTPGSPGYTAGNGNLQADPMFLDPDDILGPDGIAFTSDDGFNLQPGSPAIGAGAGGVDIGPYAHIDSSCGSGTCDLGEDCSSCPGDCGNCSSCSPADADDDSVVSNDELVIFISQWNAGNVTIGELITAIGEWKHGC